MTIETTHAVHTAEETVVPVQAGPADVPAVHVTEAPRAADHVRTHSRACWWDFVECRWVCAGD